MTLDSDRSALCATCGNELLGDLEDDPFGASGLPLCGDCNRARNFAAIEEQELFADDDDDAENA